MPAGTNPALARAIGVMLKNAWLQSLLRRPAAMKKASPAATSGRPSLSATNIKRSPASARTIRAATRKPLPSPGSAASSPSSPPNPSARSAPCSGSSEAWRTLLQTLRTRIFLSLSDEASAEIASKLCGQVRKLKATYAINETSWQSGINFLSAQAGGGRGSVGASKSFTDHREAGVSAARLRAPRQLSGDLSPLRWGAVPATPARVPQAPLSAGGSPVLARETDRPAMTGDGLDLLKPFLPGLEAALDDPGRERNHDQRAGQRVARRPRPAPAD